MWPNAENTPDKPALHCLLRLKYTADDELHRQERPLRRSRGTAKGRDALDCGRPKDLREYNVDIETVLHRDRARIHTASSPITTTGTIMKTSTPMRAIRAKCLECSNCSPKEARECHIADCALHPYRHGRRPSTEARRALKKMQTAA